jgi:hypothetical protein
VDRHWFVDDLALAASAARTAVALHEIDAVEDDEILFRQYAHDRCALSAILSCDHYYFISFFQFHMR